MLVSINAVALHWARLVLGWVTAFGQVNCLTTQSATQANSAFHRSWVGKWVSAIAGKAKAGTAHSDCGWTCGCAGKTVRSLDNTWELLGWCFTNRHYIKCTYLHAHCCLVSPSRIWTQLLAMQSTAREWNAMKQSRECRQCNIKQTRTIGIRISTNQRNIIGDCRCVLRQLKQTNKHLQQLRPANHSQHTTLLTTLLLTDNIIDQYISYVFSYCL